MKFLYSLAFLCLSYLSGFGQGVLLTEHFNYPADSLLQSNGWFGHSAATTNPIRVTNGGLSWTTTPYLGSGIGNAAAVRNTGADENRPFSSSINTGAVYISFLLRVNGVVNSANTGFFLHTGEYSTPASPVFTAVSSSFRARTFITPSSNPAKYKLGLAFNAATITGDTTALNLDTATTYLVVVKYQFIPGTQNDSVSLYVFADGSNIATEPAVAAIGPLAGTVADATALQYVALRQYSSTQNITVDGLIAQTSWNMLPLPAQTSLPITWDDPAVGYSFTDFGGNSSALAPSPTDSTNRTLRTEKTNGAQTWAGTTITPTTGLANPIPFASGATSISVKVFSPAAGVIVRLKAEQAGVPTISVETEDTTTSIGWQTLVFNFANQATGTAPINFANTYNVLSIFYNFGTAGTGTVYYADSVFFGGGPVGPPPTPINLPITWDNLALNYSFTDFGGNASTLAPSPTDSTNRTLRSEKTVGAQTWAGTTVTPPNGLGTAIPFAAGSTRISVKVHAPASGIVVRLKAEQAGIPTISVETEATTTTSGWQTLLFDFANHATGTAPINFANTYNMLSIFYGFGTAGTGAVFYADSIYFGGTPVVPPRQVSVTFQVDMSRETISPNGIHMAGDFQGWSPNATPMTSMGNGIYSRTIQLNANASYEFKYINGNQWGPGFDESVPASCARNNNRFIDVDTTNITIQLVCFGRCVACGVSVYEPGALNNAIRVYPNPASSQARIEYAFETAQDIRMSVYDIYGKLVAELSEKGQAEGSIELDVQDWAEGLYHVRINNGFEQITRKLVVSK